MPLTTPEFRAALRKAAEDNDPVAVGALLDYGSRVLDLLADLAAAEQRALVAEKAVEIAVGYHARATRLIADEEGIPGCLDVAGLTCIGIERAYREARTALGLPPAEEAGPAAPEVLAQVGVPSDCSAWTTMRRG